MRDAQTAHCPTNHSLRAITDNPVFLAKGVCAALESSVESTESTATLLGLVREGRGDARERLMGRYLPLLRRWATGRLPHYTRDLNDTQDLVQITLMQTLGRLEGLSFEREGAFLAYLRAALMNAIRSEIRRHSRQGTRTELATEPNIAAPVDPTLDMDAFLDYEAALERLSPERREAVILRLEFGMSFSEIAIALNRPTAGAAHMLVSRALVDLAEGLG